MSALLFPELRQWLRKFAPDSGELLSLDLKNFGFDTVNLPSAQWYWQNGYPQIASILSGGAPAWSGESVNLESALGHSVVYACNRVVSEPLGFLPAFVMQDVKGAKRHATEHPMYRAMKYSPNDEISAQTFRETRTSHALLQGNGYAKIIRRSTSKTESGTAIQLEHLLPSQVEPDRDKQKRLIYVIKNELGATDKTYTVEAGKPQDILHIRGMGFDGVRGYSVIHLGRNSIGSAISGEKNLAAFWAGGGRVPYHLEHPGPQKYFRDEQDFSNFRKDWQTIYADPHLAPILERGMKYVQDGISMRDSQGVENRAFTVPELCRWFNVSPHLVADLSRATFSNIEQLALEFVKLTLSPWLSRWESEFYRCVLTPEEQAQGYYLKYNVNALLRGDFKTRMDGYASALQNGHLNVDEVRDLEDKNPLPDGAGSHWHIQLNMTTLPGKGDPPLGQDATQGTGPSLVRLN